MKMLHFIIKALHKLLSLSVGKGFGVGIIILFSSLSASAQIGDATNPMRFSIHTYSVTMGNILDDVTWNIYDSTATRERIDAGLEIAYSKTTDYLVNAQWIAAGTANITIEFTGNLVVGRLYRIAYREESNDECYIIQFLNFRLQSPIDVDIVQAADQCPGSNLIYIEGLGSPVTHTTIEYHVVLRTTDYNPPGNWYFNYQIVLTGQSGASATIDEVDYGTFTFTQPPLNSSYSNSAIIPILTRDVQFLVTINDVPGVRQRIDFRLDQIEGAFSERDIDVIIPKPGENEIVHYIESLPGASYIAALD
jgi:hypothetical protein